MSKTKLRRITIGKDRYLWAIRATYIRKDTLHPEYHAHVKFTAYLEGHKATPLVINFITWEYATSGNPLTSGIDELNLHKPSLAKILILGAIERGWNANNSAKTIEDGKTMLKETGYDISNI